MPMYILQIIQLAWWQSERVYTCQALSSTLEASGGGPPRTISEMSIFNTLEHEHFMSEGSESVHQPPRASTLYLQTVHKLSHPPLCIQVHIQSNSSQYTIRGRDLGIVDEISTVRPVRYTCTNKTS